MSHSTCHVSSQNCGVFGHFLHRSKAAYCRTGWNSSDQNRQTCKANRLRSVTWNFVRALCEVALCCTQIVKARSSQSLGKSQASVVGHWCNLPIKRSKTCCLTPVCRLAAMRTRLTGTQWWAHIDYRHTWIYIYIYVCVYVYSLYTVSVPEKLREESPLPGATVPFVFAASGKQENQSQSIIPHLPLTIPTCWTLN